jgi:hypothetical protein
VVDERTAGRSYPLPHPQNDLAEDLPRLRAALTAIDADVAALEALLSSDDPLLDTLQELVTSIKANKTTINALLADKVDRAEFTAANKHAALFRFLDMGDVIDIQNMTKG